MTDELLTPDALRAIAARAEALDALNGTLSRVKQLRDPDWRLGVISGHVAYPLDDDQAETAWRFVEHAQDDVPRLLAHIRAQDAALARLRDALAAVAALGELPYVPQDGCTADGRIEAANIAKRALDGEGSA